MGIFLPKNFGDIGKFGDIGPSCIEFFNVAKLFWITENEMDRRVKLKKVEIGEAMFIHIDIFLNF